MLFEDWTENCSSCTRTWGLGMAIMPPLSLDAAPAGPEITDLGATVQALVRQLRAHAEAQVSAV